MTELLWTTLIYVLGALAGVVVLAARVVIFAVRLVADDEWL